MRLPIDEIEPLLGLISDSAIAEQFEVSRERIRQLRKERGIPKVTNNFNSPYYKRTIELVDKLDTYKDQVGSISDYKVAKLAGVTVYAVKKYREAHNIESWCHKKFDADGLLEIEKDLGTASDAVVGKKHNISRLTAFRLRKNKGIPSVRNRQAI